MKKKTRKARKTELADLDTLKPLDLTVVGTVDDPCFGKLHDATAKACKNCGDSDICQIVMGQLNHVSRKAEESKSKIIDSSPEAKLSTKVVSKYLRLRLKGKGKVAREDVITWIIAKYNANETTATRVLRKIAAQSDKMKLTKTHITYES